MTIREFNEKLALKITGIVGTMWAAYLFAGIAFISLPAAIMSGDPVIIVAWISQAFLQLVLLAVIMVGQDVQARSVQKKIDETHAASLAEFELAKAARQSHAEELAAIKKLLLEIKEIGKDVDSISSGVKNIGQDVDTITDQSIDDGK